MLWNSLTFQTRWWFTQQQKRKGKGNTQAQLHSWVTHTHTQTHTHCSEFRFINSSNSLLTYAKEREILLLSNSFHYIAKASLLGTEHFLQSLCQEIIAKLTVLPIGSEKPPSVTTILFSWCFYICRLLSTPHFTVLHNAKMLQPLYFRRSALSPVKQKYKAEDDKQASSEVRYMFFFCKSYGYLVGSFLKWDRRGSTHFICSAFTQDLYSKTISNLTHRHTRAHTPQCMETQTGSYKLLWQ